MKNKKLEEKIKKEGSAALVVNTFSRKGEKLFFAAHDLLEASGVSIPALYPVRDPKRLTATVKQAIDEGHTLVIVGGGDGTLSAIVDYFANSDVVLGILPLGTANSFVRSLGIPASLAEAVKIIAEGHVVTVDLGKINDDYFANVASIGFTAIVADTIPDSLKRWLGTLAYAVHGISKALRVRPFTCTVTEGKTSRTFTTYQLIIANGSYYGPSSLAQAANVNSGTITLLTMEGLGRRQLVWMWLQSLWGKSLADSGVQTQVVREATLETTPAQDVNIDGEISHRTPIKITVAPKALKILVPKKVK